MTTTTIAPTASSADADRPTSAPEPHARIDIAALAPAAYKAMIALDSRAHAGPLPAELTELVKLRASQINGCAYCVDAHSADAAKAGASPARVAAVAAWEEGPFFTPAERAALDLTESMTRLSEGAPRVPDEVWSSAAEHYGPEEMAQLVMLLATINAWNRIGVGTRMVPDSYQV
ncbi:MAG: carboxymuconolactone decarboxylase family protein [Actinomycetales bacterium]